MIGSHVAYLKHCQYCLEQPHGHHAISINVLQHFSIMIALWLLVIIMSSVVLHLPQQLSKILYVLPSLFVFSFLFFSFWFRKLTFALFVAAETITDH